MSLRKNISTLIGRMEKDFKTQNRVEVSASALLSNVDFFAEKTNKNIIPVLKGNAYGHGIEHVARVLRGRKLPYIAVDGYFEALRIREVSPQPVLVMGAIAPENFAQLKYDNFAFVVGDMQTIDALGKTGKHVNVHLECNTGMNRYGARPADMTALTERIMGYKNLTLEGVMSHLADSDGDDAATVDAAVQKFDECVEAIRMAGASPTMIHVAQSAGSMKARSQYADTIRLGIGLYGINPFPPDHALYHSLDGLRPALKLISTITKTINLKKGESVSYNYTFTAPRDMKIGILPLGYYEGVNRALSNSGVVKIGSLYAPIVGRVCMNHTMVSLDGIDAVVGDEVVVYSDLPSDENSINTLAHKHGLFNYGMLTAINQDVRHVATP